MADRIEQQVPAFTREVWADGLEFSYEARVMTFRFRTSDGHELRKQVTGQAAEDLIVALNNADFRAKSLDRVMLEQAQARWPEEFAGAVLSD